MITITSLIYLLFFSLISTDAAPVQLVRCHPVASTTSIEPCDLGWEPLNRFGQWLVHPGGLCFVLYGESYYPGILGIMISNCRHPYNYKTSIGMLQGLLNIAHLKADNRNDIISYLIISYLLVKRLWCFIRFWLDMNSIHFCNYSSGNDHISHLGKAGKSSAQRESSQERNHLFDELCVVSDFPKLN